MAAAARPLSRVITLLLPQVFRPDAPASGSNDAVGVDGVLDGFVEPQKGAIVEVIGPGNFVDKGWRRTILAIAVLASDLDDAGEALPVPARFLGVPLGYREARDENECVEHP